MKKAIKFQIKLITEDGMGTQYVPAERVEIENDGSLTFVVKAWRDPDLKPVIIENEMVDTLS